MSDGTPRNPLGSQPTAVEPVADNTNPLLEAIRVELRKLTKSEGFGAGTLLTIQKIAKAGRQLLIAADPRVRIKRPYLSEFGEESEEDDGLPDQTPTNPSETYGATLAREFMPAIQKVFRRGDDLEEIREQIKKAREDGMDEEVKILQDRLRGKPLLDPPSTDDYLEKAREDLERIKDRHKGGQTALDVQRPSTLPAAPEEQS